MARHQLIPAARYYAVYAHTVRLLAPSREPGLVSDTDLTTIAHLAWYLAQAHALEDTGPVPGMTVQAAVTRAEGVTDGLVDIVRESQSLRELLTQVTRTQPHDDAA